jgi:hypothetical protein
MNCAGESNARTSASVPRSHTIFASVVLRDLIDPVES